MGRYYSGDIEGKFWFGVQSSDAADRFGVEGVQPNYLDYYFDDDNYTDVRNEVQAIKDQLGILLPKLDQFFTENESYTNEKLAEFIGKENVDSILRQYADLQLGEKIKKCLEENGECSFMAEC